MYLGLLIGVTCMTEHGTIGHAWFIDILLSLMYIKKLYSHRSPLIHVQQVVNLLYMPPNHDLYVYIT